MAKAKWICVPATRDIIDPTVKSEKKVLIPDYTFFKFLMNNLLYDKQFSANWKTIRLVGEIEDAFKDANEGEWHDISITAWDLLKKVCEEPSQPFANAHLLPQALDMFEAIVDKAADRNPADAETSKTKTVEVPKEE